MTLPSKGRRTITVDNVAYHWMVRDNGDHLTVAIELGDAGETGEGREAGEGGGQTLKAVFSRHAHDTLPAITPTTVTRLIHCAIADGWQPTAQGPTHALRNIPDNIFAPD